MFGYHSIQFSCDHFGCPALDMMRDIGGRSIRKRRQTRILRHVGESPEMYFENDFVLHKPGGAKNVDCTLSHGLLILFSNNPA